MHLSRKQWKQRGIQAAEEGEGGGTEVQKEKMVQERLFTPQEWWRVFLQTCSGLLQLGHTPRALHLIHCAQATKKFSTEQLETVRSTSGS